jgi:hypothetical protein
MLVPAAADHELQHQPPHQPGHTRREAAFLFYRDADETTTSRLACDNTVPNCKRDRDPVVKIQLPNPSLGRMLARVP